MVIFKIWQGSKAQWYCVPPTVSDPRFSGQSGRNLRMFRGLCGTAAFKNVVVLTTFWDQVSTSEGVRRDVQLKSNFFKGLLIREACFMRHDHKIESMRQGLKHISTSAPTITRIHRDVREKNISLEDIVAGSMLREEVEIIIAKYKVMKQELRKETASGQSWRKAWGKQRNLASGWKRRLQNCKLSSLEWRHPGWHARRWRSTKRIALHLMRINALVSHTAWAYSLAHNAIYSANDVPETSFQFAYSDKYQPRTRHVFHGKYWASWWLICRLCIRSVAVYRNQF